MVLYVFLRINNNCMFLSIFHLTCEKHMFLHLFRSARHTIYPITRNWGELILKISKNQHTHIHRSRTFISSTAHAQLRDRCYSSPFTQGRIQKNDPVSRLYRNHNRRKSKQRYFKKDSTAAFVCYVSTMRML